MMSSLYARFVKETVNWETLEDEDSFVTYEFQKVGPVNCLKIIEMYVAPHARGNDKWRELADRIEEFARKEKCKTISAQISKSTSEFTQQRTAHLCRLFGMQHSYEDVYQIVYSRSVRYE
jgi:GNAT superfamily N-acetyltransferase